MPPSYATKHAVENSQESLAIKPTENERNSESSPTFHSNDVIRKSSDSTPSDADLIRLHDGGANSSDGACSQSSRLRLLRSTCIAKYHTSLAPKGNWHVKAYVDEKHKVFACLPAKSGSTTWKTILANNSFPEPFQLEADHPINRLVKKRGIPGAVPFKDLSSEKKDHILNSKEYFRFVVARHPFERIYSAYKDRIVEGKCSGKIRYVMLKRKVRKMFRKNITKEEWKKGDGVTFKEFIRYLKIKGTTNQHFLPAEEFCHPCLINYDYIVKTETMNEDNEYIIDRFLGPTKRGMRTVQHVVANKPEADDRPLLSPKGRVLKTYESLTAEDIAFLVKWFGADFLHFGYGWRVENSTGNAAVYSLCSNGEQGEGSNACC